MNIRALYSNIEQISHLLFTENTNQLFITIDFESEFTIARVLALLHSFKTDRQDDVLTPDNVNMLINFLAERWENIKNSDLAYPHCPRKLGNIVCLTLAQELERLTEKSRYKLVMPTIQIECNEISTTEIREGTLAVHEFVLSDDNDRIIDIIPCLEFASEDGVLKHTSLFNGQAKKLSKTEAERVIGHSTQARDYYNAMLERVTAKTKSSSFGAVLTRLAESLRAGGTHGKHKGGEELNAGRNANEAIYFFSEWLQTINAEERARLFACRAPALTNNFGEIWGRLARPNDADYMRTIYCVSLMADEIDNILSHNKHLFDTYPENNEQAKTKIIDQLDNISSARKNEFLQAIRGNNYQVTASYGNSRLADYMAIFSTRFAKYIEIFLRDISILNDDMRNLFLQRMKLWVPAHFRSDYRACLASLGSLPEFECRLLLKTIHNEMKWFINSLTQFSLLYQSVPKTYQPVLLTEFHDWLFGHIRTFEDLCQVLQYFPVQERLQLFMNSNINLSDILTNGIQPSIFMSILDPEHRIQLLVHERLRDSIRKAIEHGFEFANLLSWLPDNARMAAVNHFSDHLPQIIADLTDFRTIYGFIPRESKMTVIQILKAKLFDLIENGEDLAYILSSLQPEDKSKVITQIGHDLKSIIHVSADFMLCLAVLNEKDKALLIETLGSEVNEIITDKEELPLIESHLSVQNIQLLHKFYQENYKPGEKTESHKPENKSIAGGIFSFFQRIFHLPIRHNNDHDKNNDELKHKPAGN